MKHMLNNLRHNGVKATVNYNVAPLILASMLKYMFVQRNKGTNMDYVELNEKQLIEDALVAAAPEMLQMLEKLAHLHDSGDWHDEVQALINKAKGV